MVTCSARFRGHRLVDVPARLGGVDAENWKPRRKSSAPVESSQDVGKRTTSLTRRPKICEPRIPATALLMRISDADHSKDSLRLSADRSPANCQWWILVVGLVLAAHLPLWVAEADIHRRSLSVFRS
jgi:hypothetical protein